MFYSLNMSNRTHQASLWPHDATRAWTENPYSDLHSCSARIRQNKNRDIMSVSRRTFGKLEDSPTTQVNALEMLTIFHTDYLPRIWRILSPSNFLNSVESADSKNLFADAYSAVYQTLYEAKPMFRNGYNIWRCSRTFCSHPSRKSTNVLWSAADVPFYLYF